MPNEKNQPDEIEIKWEYDKDYRLVPANGMWGGITPRGDLRIEFFVEAISPPSDGETALFNEGKGRYKERPKGSRQAVVVRQVQVGVMVSPHQIPSFAEWFKDKAQNATIVTENPSKKVN